MWGKKKLICFWKETVKFLENIKKEHGKNHSETKRKIIKIMKLNHYSKRRRGKRENLDKIHL
jgi:predicted ThiF/HesA family dinucleotide-utilizing enzyme